MHQVYSLQRPDFQIVTPSATPSATPKVATPSATAKVAGEGFSPETAGSWDAGQTPSGHQAPLCIGKAPAILRAYMEAGPVKRPTRAIQKVLCICSLAIQKAQVFLKTPLFQYSQRSFFFITPFESASVLVPSLKLVDAISLHALIWT